MFPKSKRVVDKKLLKEYHGKKCCICGSTDGTVAHHVRTRGAGGSDVKENLIPVCAKHHKEIHDTGCETFLNKYGPRGEL